MEEKVKRFLELSKKFSKSAESVFGDDRPKYNTINGCVYSNSIGYNITDSLSINGREIYIDSDGTVKAKDNKELSRAEKIRAEAEIKATLAEEYDEYIKLQNDLSLYYAVLNNLNN